MMTVMGLSTQDLTATHRLNKQDTSILSQNPEHSKRKNILVDIDDYNSLKKELADQNKTNNFLQSSGNL